MPGLSTIVHPESRISIAHPGRVAHVDIVGRRKVGVLETNSHEDRAGCPPKPCARFQNGDHPAQHAG